MAQTKTTKPRKPRGKPKRWQATQIDAFAQPDNKGADQLARTMGGLLSDLHNAIERGG